MGAGAVTVESIAYTASLFVLGDSHPAPMQNKRSIQLSR